MLRAVFGRGLSIWQNTAMRCLVRMEWLNGNVNTRKPHKKGTPQRAFRTHGGGCLLAGIKGEKEGCRAQLFFALVFDWHLAGKHGESV